MTPRPTPPPAFSELDAALVRAAMEILTSIQARTGMELQCTPSHIGGYILTGIVRVGPHLACPQVYPQTLAEITPALLAEMEQEGWERATAYAAAEEAAT
jgi:hypothetical protein